LYTDATARHLFLFQFCPILFFRFALLSLSVYVNVELYYMDCFLHVCFISPSCVRVTGTNAEARWNQLKMVMKFIRPATGSPADLQRQ